MEIFPTLHRISLSRDLFKLIGLVELFFQVIIDRILPFQREASLLVVVAIFIAVSVFQMGFEVYQPLGILRK